MKMWNKVFVATSALSVAVAFSSCSKDPLAGMTAEESRIYITNFDSTANFSSYKTYTISDSVAVQNGNQSSKEQTPTDVAYVNAVKAQMKARGFTLVSRSATPDLAVSVNRVYNTTSGIIRYNDYYGMYGNSWDPYYYGYSGYGYYSPFSYATYSITEGALSIDVLDLKNAKATNRIGVVWSGLVRGTGILNSNVAVSQVQMLVDQSPYLKANQ
jgi:hypothetical protein